jgi:hypothetical protein
LTEIVLDYGSLGMGKSHKNIAGSSSAALFPDRWLAILLITLWLTGSGCLMAAESSSATTAPPPALAATKNDPSALMRETRQYVAQVTEERNQLRDANDGLRNRQGLLAAYGVVMTLLAAWLIARQLKGATGTAGSPGDTDIFSSSTSVERNPNPTVVMRKNATITIRNGATQQAEVTGRVQTRQAFARTDTATQPRPNPTRSIARTPTPPVAAPTVGSETVRKQLPTPAAVPVPASATQSRTHPATTQRPTVRIEQHSDRLEPVEVALKPGTGSIRRNPGFSSVEMLIAVLMFTAFAFGLMQVVVISPGSGQPELSDHNAVLLKH